MRRGSPLIPLFVLIPLMALGACAPHPPVATPVPSLASPAGAPSPAAALPTRTAVAAAGSTVRLSQEAGLADVLRIEIMRGDGSGADPAVIDDPDAVRLAIQALGAALERVPIPAGGSPTHTLRLTRLDAPAEVWLFLPGADGGLLFGEQAYFRGKGVAIPAELNRLLSDAAVGVSAVTPTPSAAVERASTPEVQTAELTSERYGVTLRYPAAWGTVPGYDGARLGGPDGFLQLDAAQSPNADIDAVADLAAHHQLVPYGSEPSVLHLVVAGEPARLILPSADQAQEMAGQAQLVVQYPEPRVIDGEPYSFLVVHADAEHLRAIAATLAFGGATRP